MDAHRGIGTTQQCARDQPRDLCHQGFFAAFANERSELEYLRRSHDAFDEQIPARYLKWGRIRRFPTPPATRLADPCGHHNDPIAGTIAQRRDVAPLRATDGRTFSTTWPRCQRQRIEVARSSPVSGSLPVARKHEKEVGTLSSAELNKNGLYRYGKRMFCIVPKYDGSRVVRKPQAICMEEHGRPRWPETAIDIDHNRLDHFCRLTDVSIATLSRRLRRGQVHDAADQQRLGSR